MYPLELEHGYPLDILSFNWNSFVLNLRGMPLVLPLSKTGFNRLLIRNIFKSPHGMYKIIACNKSLCHLTILHPFAKILNQPTKRRPTKPIRLNLIEPMNIDMAIHLAPPQSILFTNNAIESARYNSNQSCIPIDCANGTSLNRDYTHLPNTAMGDNFRHTELDQRQPKAENGDRHAVQRSGNPDFAAEELHGKEDSEREHPDPTAVTGISV